MSPSMKTLRQGLRRTTEALARQLARPTEATPDWNELEWQLAMAVAAAHGVSPLLGTLAPWQHGAWSRFVAEQRAHVLHRHRRIQVLLERLAETAHAAGVALVPLKGAALHGPGLYLPGDRPMADIDLLVDGRDADRAARLLLELGYEESFAQWKHRVFKPVADSPPAVLGEHRDTPVNIELHTRIQERLPLSTVDVTARILAPDARPGLNAYPSNGALMCHLLLHAAGNLCNRTTRLIQLNDIALLAMRMLPDDWNVLWQATDGEAPWWALPPLALVARYYPHAISPDLLARLAACCPPVLRAVARRQDLTRMSCSALWLHPLAGIEWSRSLGEARHYLANRISPPAEAIAERQAMVRTQLWLQGQRWVGLSRGRRMLASLAGRAPRMDTLYVVRTALRQP
ncbi:nucleotidyltransferase family protein [Dyella sedimenti]|uniref:nucleotidyltransferase family protein n=1 Tax=Dyella sedimenti TaxID=2919947 RepID=UPI001FAA1D8F|nr:nucleotidyltransferase family protein [Dyella sedimenti]